MKNELRERFLKIYANLPLSLRKEIILVLEKEPLTWNAVYIEVYNKTKRCDKILNKLEKLKII